MTLTQAIEARHSVRQYLRKPLESAAVAALNNEIEHCNAEGGLHLQLVTDEPKAFDSFMAHYGKFAGVENYIALVGSKATDLDERLGYYGERVVLRAQQLGLNTCWVGLTYTKVDGAFVVGKGERLRGVIAVGYGAAQGVAHRSKTATEVAKLSGSEPQWFLDGVACALKAPTAMNQQKFRFSMRGDRVAASAGIGFYAKMDLGIARLHFEIGSGKDRDVWE